ncbi:type VI secretion system amidase immunity protein Tai4 [Achromobacter seleniivolatilans]|uniref:Type VI secretion system amidase immunity protein Tai4 n=1 Tax=Achromobacter seleniivolatilans TaxID=3047478 RepID=A0ABY9LVT2_9BURK|nr:type VI secretion system amidase immunity protein Tai4 [Achromobacter sp. R39]WMD18642.1 type VI secretion system amidase immunity protein Tai4 [Achromobacter sp. R39]
MKITLVRSLSLILVLFASYSHANDAGRTSPQAGARTYAQNYKDMVLAQCIATAYKDDRQASTDAGSSVTALRDWTNYDWDKHAYDEVVSPLVEKYLARDYHNPLAEAEIKGIQFSLLKCLDLYHSEELATVVKHVVINPMRTYRQDNQPSAEPR